MDFCEENPQLSIRNHMNSNKGKSQFHVRLRLAFGVGPSYLIDKNGDIGNHGFSKLKVSSTLKYLSPLGQECNAFALLPFGILCCSFYPRKSHYRLINGPFWRLIQHVFSHLAWSDPKAHSACRLCAPQFYPDHL